MNRSQFAPDEQARAEAIKAGLKKYEQFKDKVKNHDYIVIVNMKEPSYRKRLYVLDKDRKVIRNHHVAHGTGSANPRNLAYAISFSNVVNSHKTSLGAMITGSTYVGSHGRSLKLLGLEKGINDNVFSRYIVMHQSNYVTDAYIANAGRAGMSWGCLAVDPAITQSLITLVKNGCFVYVYYK